MTDTQPSSNERVSDADIQKALDADWKTLHAACDRLDEAAPWLRTHILALQELQRIRGATHEPQPATSNRLCDLLRFRILTRENSGEEAIAKLRLMAADEIELLEQRLKVAHDCLHQVLSTAHEPEASDAYLALELRRLVQVAKGFDGFTSDTLQTLVVRHDRKATPTKCAGCNGVGHVGGLTPEGYESQPCPFCTDSGESDVG